MSLNTPNTLSLFGIEIHNDSLSEAADKVMASKRSGLPKTVCFVNVNTINLAKTHSDLIASVNDADYVFADGVGMRIAASRQGQIMRDNVNGTDLLPLLCERAAEQEKSLFLLGAQPGVAALAAKRLEAQYDGLNIAGVHHGFFDKQSSQSVIDCINNSGASVLLVAFGSPIQETWVRANRHLLRVDVVLAVGGLFDFFSGRIPRAPLWLRKLSLEWVFRLIQEPRKKFNRYVIGNPVFLWRCFWELKRA